MLLKPVKSSNILAVGYDAEKKLLGVMFKKGAVYHYQDVPPGVYDAFASAPSKGTYLAVNIKGAYKSEKVKG